MTSSRSSSSRRLARAAGALALALAASGCRHAQPAPAPPRMRLVVFPVQNASGGAAPVRALTEALDAALAARGVDAVPRPELDAVLARHRIRFTGGVDRATARAVREELRADAVVVPTLELYSADAPPKVALAWRVVLTSERPVVFWADEVSRSGDDAPGLLGLGLMRRPAEVERAAVEDLARSLQAWLATGAAGAACGDAGRFGPRRVFRSPALNDVGRRVVAVLPFLNGSGRRGADEVVLGQFVAQLARSGSFDVLDPGVVREELLGHRIILEGGVSVDAAMTLLQLLEADLVLSGFVEVYAPPVGGTGTADVELGAYVLDARTSRLVWSSSSSGSGDDGVWLWGAGRVHTASGLSCRMARGVVDRLVEGRGRLP